MYRNVQTDQADVGSKHVVSGDLEQSFWTKPAGQDKQKKIISIW